MFLCKPMIVLSLSLAVQAGPYAYNVPEVQLNPRQGIVMRSNLRLPTSSNVYTSSPEVFVDRMIAVAERQGRKVSKVLKTLQGNQIVAKALAATSITGDPCSIIPSNLDSTVEGLLKGLQSSRAELINLISIVQDLKEYKGDTANSIKSAADAISSSAALIPYFASVIKTNPECQSTLDAATNTAAGFGIALDALDNSNIFQNDASASNFLRQSSQASKVISGVTSQLGDIQFTSLCSDSATFSEDILDGASELLAGFKDIFAVFNIDEDDSSLSETIDILKETADVLRSLDLSGLAQPTPSSSSSPRSSAVPDQCSTSITDVAESIKDVSKLISAFNIQPTSESS